MCYDCGDLNPSLGDWVVVKSGDFSYLGQVVTAPVICRDNEGALKADNGGLPSVDAHQAAGSESQLADYDLPIEEECFEEEPLSEAVSPCPEPGDVEAVGDESCRLKVCGGRRMLRLASESDMVRQAEHEVREKEAFEYCLSRVNVQGLDMKLVAVEVLFDGSKTIFYYTAEERVDFRLLVKELVSRFRTRIEMRQIGVRHEARMVGGLGQCGRCFCCSGFLSNFAPVSVKMAKEQNISLSPSKISGVCGRLMCCLAFEHCGPLPKGSSKNNRDIDC